MMASVGDLANSMAYLEKKEEFRKQRNKKEENTGFNSSFQS
jgi:hypothetical protein